MRVLIVDDSVVYRSKIRAALASEPWIEVVGTASNGKIALEMLEQKSVDLVTLDMEMPVMGGLDTLKALRQKGLRTKVIVFSSLTRSGSEATLEALSNGANDFVAKPNNAGDAAQSDELIRKDLIPKVIQFRGTISPTSPPVASSAAPARSLSTFQQKQIETFSPAAIVIASSTGGPAAHDEIFRELKGKLRCPILIAQHMPPVFTASLARRIGGYAGLPCKEAQNGEPLANEIYIAPGDFHLTVAEVNGKIVTQLDKGAQRNSVRPAADFLFESAARLWGPKCMGFVLTGMGEDGLEGAKAIKASGGGIMIQSAETCVVFGMPGAVFAAKAHDAIGSLIEIRKQLARMAFT